jgi:tape measure domain-containing protein
MSGNIEFGIKLKFDGKDVEGGVTISREHFRNLAVDVQRAGKAMSGAYTSAAEGVRSVSSMLDQAQKALVGFFGVRGWAQAADSWANLQSRINLVSASTIEASGAMASITGIAAQTGQSLDAVGTIWQRMARNAVQYNLSQAQIAETTRAVANAVTLSGASAASAQAALMQFGQALSSGQLRGEELNSVMEQTPALAEAIARGMGKTIGELRRLGEEGRLTAEDVLGAIRHESARLEQEASGMALTIGRAMQQLENAFQKWSGEGSAGGAAAQGIQFIANNFGTLANAASVAAGAFGAFKLASWVSNASFALAKMHPVVRAVTLATGGLIGAYETLGAIREILPKSAFAETEARLAKLSGDIQNVLANFAALSVAQARAKRAQIADERNELGDEISRRQNAIEAYGGPKRSSNPEYRRMSDELETLNRRYQDLTLSLRDVDAAMPTAGTKKATAFLQEYATEAAKAALKTTEAAAKFRAAYDDAKDNAQEQARLVAGFSAWLIEADKKANKERGGAHERAIDAAVVANGKAYVDVMSGLAKVEAEAASGALGLSKAQETLMAYMQSPAWAAATDDVRQFTVARFEEVFAAEQEAQANAAADKAREASLAQRAREAVALEERATQAELEIAQYGWTEAAIEATRIARAREVREIAAANGASPKYLEQLDREIDARERLAGAMAEKDVLDANKRAAEESARTWERITDDINQSLADAIMDGGKSGGDLLKRYFKSLVLTPVIQMAMAPVTSAVGQVLGFGGSTGANSALGTAGNLLSTGSGLYNLYQGYTLGTGTGLMGNVGNYLGGITGANAAAFTGPWGATVTSAELASMSPNIVFANGAAGGGGGAALSGAMGAAGWLGVAWMVGQYLSEMGGGQKQEGDAFLTIDASSGKPSIGNRWVDGSSWYTLGEQNPYQMSQASWETRKAEAQANNPDPALFAEWLRDNPPPGDGVLYQPGGAFDPAALSTNQRIGNLLTPFAAGVTSLIAGLGGNAGGLSFGLGYNTDPNGDAPDNISGAVADASGKEIYRHTYDAGRGSYQTELATEMKRMLLAAVSASDVPQVFRDLAGSMDLATASAADLDQAMVKLEELRQVKTVLDALSPAIGSHLSQAMIDAAGGAQALTANVTAYYQQFYSAAEQEARAREQLGKQFDALGVSMPRTRDEFRRLVDGLDLATESGQKTFAGLMALSPAFAQVTSAIDATATSLTDAADTLAQAEDNLRRAYEAEISEHQALATRLGDVAKTLRGYAQSLLLGDQAPLDPAGRYEAAKSAYEDVARRAALGDEGAMAQLQSVSDQLLAASRDYAQTSEQYARDFAVVRRNLDRATAVAERQRDIAQEAADTARQQLAALGTLNTSTLSVAEAIRQLQSAVIAALSAGAAVGSGSISAALAGPAGQWNTAGTGDAYWRSSAGAVATRPVGTAIDDAVITGVNGATFTIGGARDYVNQQLAAGDAMSVYGAAQASGISLGDLDALMGWTPGTSAAWADQNNLPKFAAGGIAQGMFVAGEQGPEVIYSGAPVRVLNNADSRPIMDGGAVRALAEEIARLRRDLAAANEAIARNTSETARLLRRWNGDGMPETRVVAA